MKHGLLLTATGLLLSLWKTPPATAPRVSLERYAANLRHFVQVLKATNARAVLMTPNPLCWTPKLKELYGRLPHRPRGTRRLKRATHAYPSATQMADGTLIAVWFQILPNNARELRLARFSREWLEAD